MTSLTLARSPGPGTTAPHDRLTRLFHWATVILVLSLYALYLAWGELPKGTLRHVAIVLHMSLGATLTVVLLMRMAWRISSRSTSQDRAGIVQDLAARTVHLALYLLMASQALLGWNLRWAENQPLSVFGLEVPSPFARPPADPHVLATAHYWTAYAILALSLAHAVAALVHHYVLRDGVLDRMLGSVRDV